MISFSIEGSPYTTKSHESVLVYDYAKANYEGLCDFLLDSDLCLSLHSDSVEQVWSFLKETIVKGLNLFVPKVKIFPKDHPTWFNSEICHAIKCVRSLRHKCIKHPTPNNHSKIHSLETRLKELMISAKLHFGNSWQHNLPRRSSSILEASPLPLRFHPQCPWIPPLHLMFKTRLLFLTFSVYTRSAFRIPPQEEMPAPNI